MEPDKLGLWMIGIAAAVIGISMVAKECHSEEPPCYDELMKVTEAGVATHECREAAKDVCRCADDQDKHVYEWSNGTWTRTGEVIPRMTQEEYEDCIIDTASQCGHERE